jgi:protease-4
MRSSGQIGKGGECRRFVFLASFILVGSGCLRPIQTDSRLTLSGPINTRIAAELEARNAATPVVAMPVESAHPGEPKIAIIDVDGLLLNDNQTGPMSAGENPVDLFRERLDAAAADPCVCSVVVRINSPGGSVTATDIMWRDLLAFRARTHLPVVACLMDLGCGGGYYLATAADSIVAHPTSITGGIGVVLNLYELQEFIGTFNIVHLPIKSGKNIDMGNVVASMPAETKQMLQTMADEFHERFRKVVRQQRPQVEASQGTTFDGRVFTSRQALERKLIDRIGYLDGAVEAARNLAGRPQARAVMFHRSNDVARTPYAITPNTPLQGSLFPISVPGVERSRLPTFLYLWQPDPTLQRLGGK